MNFEYLRLILALTVMSAHFGYPLLEFGQIWGIEMAVLFFFCISGYLITLSFLKDSDVLRFAKKRIARIYPPILLTVAILCLFGLATNQGLDFLRSSFALALFQDWMVVWQMGENFFQHGAFWTLVVEAQSYFLVPLVVTLWTLRTRTALLVIAGLYFLGLWGRALIDPADHLHTVYRDNVLNFAQFFIAGALFAMYAPRITDSRWFWVGMFPAAVVLYVAERLLELPYLDILQPFSMAVLVLAIARLSGLLGKKALWGDLSYGIYLYHFPVLVILAAVGVHDNLQAVVLTLLAAFVSWHLVERPILKLASSRRISSRDAGLSRPEFEGGSRF